MQAFEVKLKPSKIGLFSAVGLHTYALMLCLTSFYDTTRWLGIVAVCISLLWALRTQSMHSQQSIKTIRIDTFGRATLIRSSLSETALLQESSLIHRRACFLQWRLKERTVWQAVLPDMTDNDSYRRLIVWAKFGRSKTVLADKPEP